MIAPTVLILLGVVVLPLIYSIVISMQRYRLQDPTDRPFIGMGNYVRLLGDPEFLHSAWLTTWFTVISVGITLFLALLIALFLNVRFRGRGLLRTLLLIPWALPSVVVGLTWARLLDPNYGLINAALMWLHLIPRPEAWLGQPQTAVWAVLVTKVWKGLPFVAIMLLAGLQTIPRELYEAARVDGASLWARFRHVTVPFLMPVVQVALVLETMWTFRIFDIVYVMTGGGPADATNVISFFAYQSTFQYLDLGMGSAASYLVTLAVLGGTMIYLRLIQADLQL